MDIGTLRGLGTLLIFVAFTGLLFWAYNSKRKASFDEAAQLPFADEEPLSSEQNKDTSRSNNQ
ncbi:cbb3-type cytochrome c oxidase subunit 3 [Denitrificimonas sp. JX-1]|uniref:Cbb3-type cytochrome c oxidase subunit 3 n=1 Tax=Denitrificimonas halotolerans TaxID=3098930 RepID=A0ABU5GT06_9GAMM|nr:cbb3-type cytochrome c oxidase subunit 3 [Denitrificimonas sp. JX-1]MDY7220115.1 cbb3-type cytochrome c oxidase subunit 3 [Denitrificimonas sp. JX-1]